MKFAAAAKRPHGGIWREASQIIHSGRGPSRIKKCKAHQDISTLGAAEKATALGNDAADKRAKAALSENDLRGDIRKKVIDDNDWAGRVAGESGKRLAEWPTTHQLFGELGKELPPVGNRAKAKKKQHCFSYVDGQIRCTVCNFLPRKGEASHKECEGFPKAIVNAIRESRSKGHRLKAVGGEGRLCTFWCTNCGSHARTCPKGAGQRVQRSSIQGGRFGASADPPRAGPSRRQCLELQYDIGDFDSQ